MSIDDVVEYLEDYDAGLRVASVTDVHTANRRTVKFELARQHDDDNEVLDDIAAYLRKSGWSVQLTGRNREDSFGVRHYNATATKTPSRLKRLRKRPAKPGKPMLSTVDQIKLAERALRGKP